MKKLMISILIVLLVIPLSMVSAATLQPDSDIKVFIEGEQVSFDIDPIVINGTTLVQFTPIFNQLEIKYKWIDGEKLIIGYKDDRMIRLEIDNPVVAVNDNNIKLTAAPILFANKTFVPLRFVSEATGLTVDWNKETKEVHINKSSQAKHYVQPDYFVHTFGLDFKATDLDFLKAVKIEPDQFAVDVYTFFTYKKFGYDGELHALIAPDSDALREISYEFAAKQVNTSIVKVYRDIVEQLKQTYGEPNEALVRKYSETGYVEADFNMSDQDLLRLIRNGYYSSADWELSKIYISVLFVHDGSDLKVIVSFTAPYSHRW